jgi:hypothetical protein
VLKIHFANILLICVLGTLLLWPEISEPIVHESVSTAYDSICIITSNSTYASGVLLESGYILTAAHVIDQNLNGIIDPEERIFNLKFHAIDFEVKAESIIVGDPRVDLDIAVIKPLKKVPLPGVRLMSASDYWKLKIGTPVYTIGMQNGEYPGNITDGRIISMNISHSHRNSANSYFGNSGGGVFKDDLLIGIAVAVGFGVRELNMPVFSPDGHQVGMVIVPYTVPLANSSRHTPASSIINLLREAHLMDLVLEERPAECPYKDYYAAMAFNTFLIIALLLAFKFMQHFKVV